MGGDQSSGNGLLKAHQLRLRLIFLFFFIKIYATRFGLTALLLILATGYLVKPGIQGDIHTTSLSGQCTQPTGKVFQIGGDLLYLLVARRSLRVGPKVT